MPSQPSRQAPGDPGRQKMKRRARDPRGGAALDRRGADLGVAQQVKRRWKTRPSAFSNSGSIASGVTIAAGEAGPAGGDDGIDIRIGDPFFDDDADRLNIVDDDFACRSL